MDFIGELPASKGYNAIFVVVDQGCTKTAVFVPCTTKTSAEDTADLYLHHVWKRFGLPKRSISDRGPQFAAKVTQELCRKLDIKQNLSTAYHPQTDGETERVNQELEQYLRAFCNYRQNDWSDLLTTAEFAHNIRHHSAINQSPFNALMGYAPRVVDISSPSSSLPSVEQRLQRLHQIRSEIHASSRISAETTRNLASEKGYKPYNQGDQVWLEGKNITTTHPTAKLAPKRHGPFEIMDVLGPVTFKLQLPKSWKIHPVFHASLLTPFVQTSEHGPAYAQPPPDIINEEEEYEIEAVVNSRHNRQGKLEYLVKWEGYPDSENQWKRPFDLDHAEEAIQEFHLAHPEAIHSDRTPKPRTRKTYKKPT